MLARREALRAGRPLLLTRLATATAVFCADHLTKALVVSRLPLDARFPGGGPVVIHHVRNSGAAFGLFPQLQVLFLAVAAAVTGWILLFGSRFPRLHQQIILGAILGGAVANGIDRLTQGYVVDFIDVARIPVVGVKWAVFNVADMAITIAVVAAVLTFGHRPGGQR